MHGCTSRIASKWLAAQLLLFLVGTFAKADADQLFNPVYVARAKTNLAAGTMLTPQNTAVSSTKDSAQIPRGAMWLTAPEEAYGFCIYRDCSKGNAIGGYDLYNSAKWKKSVQKTDPLWMQYAQQAKSCDKSGDFVHSHQYEDAALAELDKMGKANQHITHMDEAQLLFEMFYHTEESKADNARSSAELKKAISNLPVPQLFPPNLNQLKADSEKRDLERVKKASTRAARDKKWYDIMIRVLPPKSQLVSILADDVQRSATDLKQAEPQKISAPKESLEITNIKRHATRVQSYKLPRSTSDQAYLHCVQGRLQMQSGDYKTALKSFNDAVAADPKCAEAYDGQGCAKARLGDYAGAVDDFNTVLKLIPNDPVAYFNRGVAQCWCKHYREAIDDFDHVTKIDKFDAGAVFNRGFAQDRLGQTNESAADFAQAAKMATFMRCVPADREHLDLDPAQVYSYFTKHCDLRDSSKNESGVQISSDHKAARAFMEEADRKNKAKDYRGAIEACNKALKADTFMTTAYEVRMMAHYGLGDRQAASEDIKASEKATALQQKYFAAEGAASRTGTIDQYNNVLKLNPTDPFAWYGRGQRRSDLGDYKGAVEDFTTSLKYKPNYANTFQCRGDARKRLGDEPGAEADYDAAAKNDAMYAMMRQVNKTLKPH